MNPKIGNIIHYDCILKGIVVSQTDDLFYVFVLKSFIYFIKHHKITIISKEMWDTRRDKIL